MSDGGVLPVDVKEALQKVMKSALIADGLSRGLHEACKALDLRQAHFCVQASNCDEPQYVKLVKALCQKHEIPLIETFEIAYLEGRFEIAYLCILDFPGTRADCLVNFTGNHFEPIYNV